MSELVGSQREVLGHNVGCEDQGQNEWLTSQLQPSLLADNWLLQVHFPTMC